MINVRFLIAVLLISTTCCSIAQPTDGKIQLEIHAPKLLASKNYKQLDAIYEEIFLHQEQQKNRNSNSEIFFQVIADWNYSYGLPPSADLVAVGLEWTSASPNSVPAAIYLGRVTAKSVARLKQLDYKKPQSTESWAIQDSLIAQAQMHLQRVNSQGASDAMWHATYLTLMSLDGATAQQVLSKYKEALAKIPNPTSEFFQSAANALDLSATNAFSELREIATLAAAKTMKREGMAMYAVVYSTAIKSMYELKRNPFQKDGADWSTMDIALSDLYQRYPSQDIKNLHPVLACLARDKARTAQLLLKLPLEQVQATWSSWPGTERLYERCKTWALG